MPVPLFMLDTLQYLRARDPRHFIVYNEQLRKIFIRTGPQKVKDLIPVSGKPDIRGRVAPPESLGQHFLIIRIIISYQNIWSLPHDPQSYGNWHGQPGIATDRAAGWHPYCGLSLMTYNPPNTVLDNPLQNDQQYHLMIGEVEDYAILLLDRNGVIRNWNKGAEKIKGYTEEEAVGMHFRMFYRQEDRESGLPEQLINLAASQGRAVHEGWRLRKNGTAFWGSVVITALHDSDGQVIGFSKVTRDLTERKEAEDRLLQYARQLEAQNKELSQFAYAAAHDMKEPLRKILMYYSAILGENGETLRPEQQHLYLRRSADAAKRMQQLIDDLLSFTKIAGTGQPLEPVDLNLLLAEVRSQFQDSFEQLGATISIARLPTVKGIPFQLRQLFVNLVSNSEKFRSATRPLTISITATRVRVPEMADAYGAERFDRIDVRDNGIGFAPDQAERIFNLFERLHGRDQFSGTGIGLAICRRIMAGNRGFIRAQGMPDEGSVFQVYFKAE
jgi:PAS domain S-box-containing protein